MALPDREPSLIVQVAILVFSALAIWLLSGRRPSRWGWVAGLTAQPFWLYATWSASQWGMFANAVIFTVIYVRGLRNHWTREAV
jgi:hypothetical protein